MVESYNVEARLTLTSNVPEVLSDLINGFEDFDRVLTESQERIAGFSKALRELGGGSEVVTRLVESLRGLGGIRLDSAFATDIQRVVGSVDAAAVSQERMRDAAGATAKDWAEIARLSKETSFRDSLNGGGVLRRGQAKAEPGDPEGHDGLLASNAPELLATLTREFGGFDVALSGSRERVSEFSKTLRALGEDSGATTKMVEGLRQPPTGGNALRQGQAQAQPNDPGAELRRRFLGDYSLARQEDSEFEARRKAAQKAEQDAFLATYADALQMDREFSAQRKAAQKAEQDAFLATYAEALQENREFDARLKAEAKSAQDAFLATYAEALQEDREFERRKREMKRQADQEWLSAFHEAQGDNRQFDRRQRELNKPRDNMGAMIGLQMTGEAGMGFIDRAFMAGALKGHELATITNDTRVTPEQTAEITKTAEGLTRTVPGSTITGNLTIFNDLKNGFGDLREALEFLPTFVREVTTLQVVNAEHGGTGSLQEALNTFKFIEDQGGAIDPKNPERYDPQRFADLANKLVSIDIATNQRVGPREMLAFQKMGRTGGMEMDDYALYGETPYFAQALGASKFGTAMFSEWQVMIGGHMIKKMLGELQTLGMLDQGAVRRVKNPITGKTETEYDSGRLKDAELFQHDPYKWIHDVLGGTIAQHLKVDPSTKAGQEAVITEMGSLASRGTIAGAWADIYRNYGVAQKEARNIQSQNPNAMQHFMDTDPLAQLKVFEAAENEFLTTLGSAMMGPAVESLKALTAALRGLTDWSSQHPNAAKDMMAMVGGMSALAQAVGGVGMALLVAKPVFEWFGGGSLVKALAPFVSGGAAAGLEGLAGVLARLTPATAGLTALVGLLKPNTSIASSEYEKRDISQGFRIQNGAGTSGHNTGHDPASLVAPPGTVLPAKTSGQPANPQVAPQQGQQPTQQQQKQPIMLRGDVHLDGQKVGSVVASTHADQVARPPAGPTNPDPRLTLPSPGWLGALQ